VPLLADKDVAVRRGAAFYLLGSFNPHAPNQVAAFSALLDDVDQTNRGIGLSAVKQMRSEDQVAAVPRLAAMLDPARETKSENRASIARLLGSLKESAAPALEPLTAALAGDPDSQVRSVCLIALAQIAPADEVTPLVTRGLADKEASVRLVAAARLRQLGAKAAGSEKELAAALADTDSRVRDAAAEALIRIGKPAVGQLAAQLASENVTSRKFALACLAKIGPDAKDVAPAIE
jgi:HEAT repeat protein